jgi:hypothetical protein
VRHPREHVKSYSADIWAKHVFKCGKRWEKGSEGGKREVGKGVRSQFERISLDVPARNMVSESKGSGLFVGVRR